MQVDTTGTDQSIRGDAPSRPSHVALAQMLTASFRAHGHTGNVLTHIAQGSWTAIEACMARLLDPSWDARQCSRLDSEILELMCDQSGIAGKTVRAELLRIVASAFGDETAEAIMVEMETRRAAKPPMTAFTRKRKW